MSSGPPDGEESASGLTRDVAERAEASAGRAEDAAQQAEESAEEAEVAAQQLQAAGVLAEGDDLGVPGDPISPHSPYYVGFVGGLGLLSAYLLAQALVAIGSVLVLIVVSMFLAAGLNPLVTALERLGMRRGFALLSVITGVLVTLFLFVVAIIPVIADQVAALSANAPDWLDQLEGNPRIQQFDDDYDVIGRLQDYIANGDFLGGLFGGVLGLGLKVLSTLVNVFVVVVLTLYFLSSVEKTKRALYHLAPASRRDRVTRLGDRVVESVGSYVSGAFVIALLAGATSLVFLFVIGLGEYAVALAFVVALLDVIPMIGATIAAVLVTAIGFATDSHTGLACLVFYLIYQQVENYVFYPRVMSRSVDIPGAVTVIAALIGAALLGVVGALLAIPTAAAVLLIIREVFQRRQDAR